MLKAPSRYRTTRASEDDRGLLFPMRCTPQAPSSLSLSLTWLQPGEHGFRKSEKPFQRFPSPPQANVPLKLTTGLRRLHVIARPERAKTTEGCYSHAMHSASAIKPLSHSHLASAR